MDLILHAWDHEAGPHTYVVITTDRDVAYALARLRMKEYRIILLSPSTAHADLTSQATIKIDWTRSILGLTCFSYDDFEDVPATKSRASSSRLRKGTLGGIQESDNPPLLDPHEPAPPRRQSSSPLLSRTYDIGSRLGEPVFPQTPPRASAWSISGDLQAGNATLPKPKLTNSMPTAATATFNGVTGASSKPLNFSRDIRAPEIKFDPFNGSDDWRLPLVGRDSKIGTKMETVTLSSESGSSDTKFSLTKSQPLSTASTSAEEGGKPMPPEPQLPTTIESVNTNPAPEANARSGPAVQETKAIPALPTTNAARIATATVTPSNSTPTPKPPSVDRSAISPNILQAWNPLIKTLRVNGGELDYLELPPKLLKSCPGAYKLAGRSKYKPYMQLAVESGIVKLVKEEEGVSVRLIAAYR